MSQNLRGRASWFVIVWIDAAASSTSAAAAAAAAGSFVGPASAAAAASASKLSSGLFVCWPVAMELRWQLRQLLML